MFTFSTLIIYSGNFFLVVINYTDSYFELPLRMKPCTLSCPHSMHILSANRQSSLTENAFPKAMREAKNFRIFARSKILNFLWWNFQVPWYVFYTIWWRWTIIIFILG